MKTNLLVAAIALGVASVTPAFAGEANYEPFANRTVLSSTSTPAQIQATAPDVGSAQYPNVAGRPGTELTQIDNADVLPPNGSQGMVASANSAPAGFEVGTVQYAQAQSIQRWMLAHNRAATPHYAAR